jgi:hypothetical protein
MFEFSPTDEAARQMQEGLMDMCAAIITNSQSAELMEPTQRAFHDPAKSAQTAAVRCTAMGDGRCDAAGPQLHAMEIGIERAVGVQQVGALSRSSALAFHRQHGIDQRNQLGDIMAAGRGEADGQRGALGIGKNVVFRAGLAAIRRIRAGFFAPPTARTLLLSTAARDQSIKSACCKRVNNTWCSFLHTPDSHHSCSRFHKVMPQQPISWGKSSHGIPVLSTNKIPVRHVRSALRGFPPFGEGDRRGRSGSTIAHSSSSTNRLDMASSLMKLVASCDVPIVGLQRHNS